MRRSSVYIKTFSYKNIGVNSRKLGNKKSLLCSAMVMLYSMYKCKWHMWDFIHQCFEMVFLDGKKELGQFHWAWNVPICSDSASSQ